MSYVYCKIQSDILLAIFKSFLPLESCSGKWATLNDDFCYLVLSGRPIWSGAATQCIQQGGYLAEPLTADLNKKFSLIAATSGISGSYYHAGIVSSTGSWPNWGWVGYTSKKPVNFTINWEVPYPLKRPGYIYVFIQRFTRKWTNWHTKWQDVGICQKLRKYK